MNPATRHGAVIVVLMLVAACGSSSPTSPTRTSQPTALPPAIPPSASIFPPLPGPSRTFVFDRELSHQVTDYTRRSRVVLYDSGAFELQYPSLGVGYRGRHKDANGVITFEWDGTGGWDATGTLEGDSLTVRYNLNMQLSDFEDAVYVLR